MAENVQSTLKKHFADVGESNHGNKWEELYQQNHTPWDRGVPHPALEDLLLEKKNWIGESWVVDPAFGRRRKRALVPGPGRGYDVLLLSAFGYDAYGLDISETALAAAKETEKNKDSNEVYRVRDRVVGAGKVTWILGDFFKGDFLQELDGDKTFDLLWDYTFLSALPPSMRPAWSIRYNQLLAPTGVLVCAEWPTYKAPHEGGPPWALPPKIYMAHLPRPGQEIPYEEDGVLLEDKLGPIAKDGLTRVEHFKPQRTHAAGIINGDNTDFIGVWQHKAVADRAASISNQRE